MTKQDIKKAITVEGLRKVFNREVPCLCHKAYKSRKLTDPTCPQCNYDYVVEEIHQYILKALGVDDENISNN